MSDLREQSSSKLEDESTDTIMSEKQKKIEQEKVITEPMRLSSSYTHIHSIGIPEGKGKGKRTKRICEEIMTKNVPNSGSSTSLQQDKLKEILTQTHEKQSAEKKRPREGLSWLKRTKRTTFLDENPTAKAGTTGSISGLGRFYILQSNEACDP